MAGDWWLALWLTPMLPCRAVPLLWLELAHGWKDDPESDPGCLLLLNQLEFILWAGGGECKRGGPGWNEGGNERTFIILSNIAHLPLPGSGNAALAPFPVVSSV
ncbi:hypothetical protein CBM2599_B50123 [Cupriavidus taiwanensis]|nr:hypothetical protein CBM2600_B10866 [Cupriavidus taiwanensis]SOY96102.1 hypothetical protein CBM2599_B50123 [Cupriavidus taiwanensis]